MTTTDPDREHRITNAVLVDAYTAEEVALGWYYYLDEQLQFPFAAIWLDNRRTSTTAGQPVQVLRLASEEDCEQDMIVEFAYEDDEFSTGLSEIVAPEADPETQQAIADWHYWCDQGSRLAEYD